jgi:hypothetical protein
MRTIWILIISFVSLPASILAQTITDVKFSFDDAGNRIEREVIYYGGQKSAAVEILEEEELDLTKGINVYPNPASHSIYVTLNKEVLDEERKMIIIFDNLGRQILQTNVFGEINRIDVSTIQNGTYILKLIYGNRQKEWIIIKN